MSNETEIGSKLDPAWKYCSRVDPRNNTKLKCNFCKEDKNGGITRIKQHFVGGSRNTTICRKCPPEVKEEIGQYMNKKEEAKKHVNVIPDFDDMMNDEDYNDFDDMVDSNSNPRAKKPSSSRTSDSIYVQSKPKKLRNIGPLDMYYTPHPKVVVENRKSKGKQPKIDENDPYKKQLKERAHQCIARWLYDDGIPLNAVNYESFGPMIEAIGQYGPGLTPPTYHQVRIPLLKKEVDHVNKLMEDHKQDWEKYGCTIMCDGWTDRKNRTLINFLVNCPKGSMFIESIDASSYSHDANKMLDLLDNFVERIGEANVVQVVTDSASANVLAGKYLEAKRPHLYWTPCAAHCLDLMLEDIFKLPNFKKTWERAIGVHP